MNRLSPQSRWWENDPNKLMAFLYKRKRQIPPTDPKVKKRVWLKIMDQLSAKYKAPYKDFKRLAQYNFDTNEANTTSSVGGEYATPHAFSKNKKTRRELIENYKRFFKEKLSHPTNLNESGYVETMHGIDDALDNLRTVWETWVQAPATETDMHADAAADFKSYVMSMVDEMLEDIDYDAQNESKDQTLSEMDDSEFNPEVHMKYAAEGRSYHYEIIDDPEDGEGYFWVDGDLVATYQFGGGGITKVDTTQTKEQLTSYITDLVYEFRESSEGI